MKYFLENFHRGKEDRKWIIHPDETTSQKKNKQQIDGRNERVRGRERKGESELSKSWIIGSASRLRARRARRHSLNLKRRCGVMKMWPLINIWGAKQVGWRPKKKTPR